ncbi:MAG: CHAT domain-containing protein [Planctomycetes bacterium]|nr:CHAT domain-containing protein [Planctomycetota bacterium]
MLALASFVLVSIQGSPAQAATPSLRCDDDVVVAELASGKESRWTLAQLRGASSVSLSSAGFVLRVEDSKGNLVATDDGARGRRPAALLLSARSGTDYVLVAGALAPASASAPTLRVRCTEESEADRAAIETARKELAAAQEHERARRAIDARACLERARAALCAVLPAGASLDRALVARDVSGVASRLGQADVAEALLRVAAADCAGLLPEFDATRLGIEQGLVSVLGAQGKFEETRPILERVWSWRRLDSEDPELAPASTMLAFLRSRDGDSAGATELYRGVLDTVEMRLAPGDFGRHIARLNLAYSLRGGNDHAGALALYDQVIAEDSQHLPEADVNAVQVRWDRAYALRELGDREGARAELERILAIAERAEPAGGRSVVLAGCEVAATLTSLGLATNARVVLEKTAERAVAALSLDDPLRRRARLDLAVALKNLGDPRAALEIEQDVLAQCEATLAPDDDSLIAARINLGATLLLLGESERARALFEDVLDVLERAGVQDEETLWGVRQNLAAALRDTGDMERVRQIEEGVLEYRLRALNEEHGDVQQARQNLASTLLSLGDMERARTLFETVLRIQRKRLPDEHRDVQQARVNLASALMAAGDLAGARSILERAWEACERADSKDATLRDTLRENLAVALMEQRQVPAARELFEAVLASRVDRLPEDSHDVVSVRTNLAAAYGRLGETARARAEIEKVLAVREAKLPPGNVDLEYARINLASILDAEGKPAEARALLDDVLRRLEPVVPSSASFLQDTRRLSAGLALRLGDVPRAAALTKDVARVLCDSWRVSPMTASPREIGARTESELDEVAWVLTFAARQRGTEDKEAFARLAFECVESLRGADLVTSAVLASCVRDPALRERHDALAAASRRLARCERDRAGDDALRDALRVRDGAATELVLALTSRPETAEYQRVPTAQRIQEHVQEGSALIAFWHYVPIPSDRTETPVARMTAFVLRHEGPLEWIDLGPEAALTDAIQAWRADLLAPIERGQPVVDRSAVVERTKRDGARVRELVFEPLTAALGDARRLVIVPEGPLHALPFEALPVGDEWLGDRYSIELRTTARELTWPARPIRTGGLLALGGIQFNTRATPDSPAAPSPTAVIDPAAQASQAAMHASSVEASPGASSTTPADARNPGIGIVQSTASTRLRFSPLPYTESEARGVGAIFEEALQLEPTVLRRSQASREALERLSPSMRFLHVATHGWFAPEATRSSNELSADRGTTAGIPLAGRDATLRGLSPMLLCGLALAGANLPPDETGAVSGIVTAEEIASWDLSSCELAVLSACDTNVGVLRAGQGVASLQKALRMAGARSAITSLWKVPDAATEELMLDFYQRYWTEKKPLRQALWEAKSAIRMAVDERGELRYSVRDWAAWVLTGAP